MKVAELAGPILDYWVARAEGVIGKTVEWRDSAKEPWLHHIADYGSTYSPSTDWAIGGPIIERENISLIRFFEGWAAARGEYGYIDTTWGEFAAGLNKGSATGPTVLIAAMRCYVASKFGETVSMKEAIAADVMNRAFEQKP